MISLIFYKDLKWVCGDCKTFSLLLNVISFTFITGQKAAAIIYAEVWNSDSCCAVTSFQTTVLRVVFIIVQKLLQ